MRRLRRQPSEDLAREPFGRLFFDLLQIGRTDIFISRVRLQLQDFARVIPWSERASPFSAQNRLRGPRDDGRCLFPGVPSGSRGPTIRFASSNRNWVSSLKFIAAKESSSSSSFSSSFSSSISSFQRPEP